MSFSKWIISREVGETMSSHENHEKPLISTNYFVLKVCVFLAKMVYIYNSSSFYTPGRVAQSVEHLTRKSRGLGSDTRSGRILSFLLPLIQEGQMSSTGQSMCTKYWLTAYVHEVLVNRLGGLSAGPRSAVGRAPDSQVRDPGFHTRPDHILSFLADSRATAISYWRKYVHAVLVNRLGGLSLPRKSVVRLTDHSDMTLDVYCGRKTTNNNNNNRRSKPAQERCG